MLTCRRKYATRAVLRPLCPYLKMTDPLNQTPKIATEAVLKLSDPVADDARQVKGVEFDDFRERDMTVKEMVTGMASMGFQASAVADAVRIINDMVRTLFRSFGVRIS